MGMISRPEIEKITFRADEEDYAALIESLNAVPGRIEIWNPPDTVIREEDPQWVW